MKERAGGKFPHLVKEQIRAAQAHRCAICGSEGHLTVHHIQPKSQGGTNGIDNALGVCRTPCHDALDYLTVEQHVPFEQIMEVGIAYFLSEYPSPIIKQVMERIEQGSRIVSQEAPERRGR